MGRPTAEPIPSGGSSLWKLPVLIVCLLLAGLLLGSWFLPLTRALWDRLDRAVFAALNGMLAGPDWWQVFWALTNHRLFDLVSALITLFIFIAFIRADGRRQLVRRAAAGLVVALYILLVRKLSALDVFELERQSASRVIDTAIRLSKEVPWVDCKDSSGKSFPGDHCMFLIMLTVFFWYYGGLLFGSLYAGMTVVFSLPRLVSGAHWLTDDLVGSGFIALVSMSILLATPLNARLVNLVEPAVRKVLGRFGSSDPRTE